MEGWEVFEKCIENLSTLLIYHCLQQKFVVNSQMIEDEKVIELLKAYSNQYER